MDVIMDEEPSYDLRIFMRSGNVVEIDQVTECEWRKQGHGLSRLRISQAEGAQAVLMMQALDLDQVEAIVRLERGPDDVG
jgi:hypothetical protein